jgi:GT2 family glycosyltransferase
MVASCVAQRPAPDTIWAMDFSPRNQVHVTVSIVLYNSSLELLRRAMHSLHRSAQIAREAGCLDRVSVYLVDNASQESYRHQLEQEIAAWTQGEFFTVLYSPQSSNRGFGFGHNAVLSLLTSDFHLVLNPDVELEDDTLRAGLSSLLQSDDIALSSPLVVGASGEQEFLCKRYPSVLVLLLRGFGPRFVRRLFRKRLAAYEMRDVCNGEAQVNVTIASGCFMLVRTSALRAVGGFNVEFFLYFEDFDLSLRLAKQGRLIFDPGMRIVHHGGYAASKGRLHLKYFIRSGLTFFNRHGWCWI